MSYKAKYIVKHEHRIKARKTTFCQRACMITFNLRINSLLQSATSHYLTQICQFSKISYNANFDKKNLACI